jgi:hypothetical protein
MSKSHHQDKLFISYPCWGEMYISTACKYSLPSFFSTGNIPALVTNGLEVILQFFTDANGKKFLTNNEYYSTITKYCVVEFIDINGMQDENTLTNNEMLIKCHNHSFLSASVIESILFPACSDLVISNESLAYFYALLIDGYTAVISSPLRVSLNAVESTVSKILRGDNSGLTATYLSDLAINNLHHSELSLLNDGDYFAAGWPGNQMWMQPNKCLIKRGIYLCPFFIRTKAGDNFGKASLDNSLYLNQFINTWEKDVYIVQDTSKSVCVDFTDDDYNIIGIDHIDDVADINKPFDRAKFVAAAMIANPCQPWHYKTLEYPIVYTATGVSASPKLLNSSACFIKDVNYWLDYLTANFMLYKFTDNAINYQREKRSANFCRYFFDSDEIYNGVEKYLTNLKTKGESVVLYGMGEWLKYLHFNIDLSLYNVILTDSNHALVDNGFSDFLCIRSTVIDHYTNNVSVAFKNEIKDFLISSYNNLTIDNVTQIRNSFEK